MGEKPMLPAPTRPGTSRTSDKVDNRVRATLTLARWRLRQTWWLLLMVSAGFVAAMIIACVVPLFTTVATSGSLQDVFQATPTRNSFTLNINTQGLSTRVIQTLEQQIATPTQQTFGSYQSGQPPLTIQENYFQVLAPAALKKTNPFNLYATSLESLKPHLQLVAGRWATSNTPGIVEIMLTPETAQALHLSPGAELSVQGDFTTVNQVNGPADPATKMTFKLVGLFEVQPSYVVQLQGQNFQPVPSGASIQYTVLAPAPSFLAALDTIVTHAPTATDAVFSYLNFQLSWNYQLQTRNVQSAQLSDLIQRLNTAETNVTNYQNEEQQNALGQNTFPYVLNSSLYNPVPTSYELLDLLQEYTNRVSLMSIPITILALQIIALLLFFVSLLMSMLVERQMVTNALLSSRGASGRQIFWSLSLQGIGICVAGLVLGPLVAIGVVTGLTLRFLPGDGGKFLAATVGQPGIFFSTIAYTAGGTLLAAILVMSLIIWHTARMNVITLRRETAHVSRQPFWLRYYLDVVAAVVALSGYGVSLYLANVAHEVDISTQDLILAPLTLVAPLFLLLGCLLLFLRVFPWLLRYGSWLASRNRGAATMLALVQMARSPGQVIRMTLLLSLTVSFAIFAQVFDASQTQRTIDISTYEAGADFSGNLPSPLTSDSIQHILKVYQAIPGVQSASADFTSDGTTTGSENNTFTVKFRAVDTQTFGKTVIWGPEESSQPLSALLDKILTSTAGTAPNGNSVVIIPAIIDQAMADQLGSGIGTVFAVTLDAFTQETLYYKVAAIVAHIPTVNTSVDAGTTATPGGMLADYTLVNQVYVNQITLQNSEKKGWIAPPIPINHLWLRTASDPRSLASVRAALNSPGLEISNLYDRWALINELQNDPFYVNILFTLTIGAISAFLLALFGNLLASWVSVRARRSSFTVLRALGANSSQIAATLLWEQGIIYAGAIWLGLAFGAVLASVTVPVLVFSDLPAHGVMSTLSITDFYLLQHAITTTIVVPPSLLLTFAALILVCILALGMMIRTVLHPSISSELRLNED
jgi:ABC-type antimicrobial peptide transport system permease subunit